MRMGDSDKNDWGAARARERIDALQLHPRWDTDEAAAETFESAGLNNRELSTIFGLGVEGDDKENAPGCMWVGG